MKGKRNKVTTKITKRVNNDWIENVEFFFSMC